MRIRLLLFFTVNAVLCLTTFETNAQGNYSAFNPTVFEKFLIKDISKLKIKIFEVARSGKTKVYRDYAFDLTYDSIAFDEQIIKALGANEEYEGYGAMNNSQSNFTKPENIINIGFLHDIISNFPSQEIKFDLTAIELFVDYSDTNTGVFNPNSFNFWIKTEDLKKFISADEMNMILIFNEWSLFNKNSNKVGDLLAKFIYSSIDFNFYPWLGEELVFPSLIDAIEDVWKKDSIKCFTDPLHKKELSYNQFNQLNKSYYIDGKDTFYNDFPLNYTDNYEWWLEKETWLSVKTLGKNKIEFQLRFEELKPFLRPWVIEILDRYLISLRS